MQRLRTRSGVRWIRRAPSIVVLALALPAAAQTPVPVGSEFQVNADTTETRYPTAVASTPDGAFVVVWGEDNIEARRYSENGSALGDEFQVNTNTTGHPWLPDVAVGSDGNFVVVWNEGSAEDSSGIRGRRFASDGSPLGGEFQVNSYTTNNQSYPSVSSASDGAFVVVWQSYGPASTDDELASIQGQRYDSNGLATGAQFQVNTYTSGHQEYPSVSSASNGDFVVVWGSLRSNIPDDDAIRAQRYASDGSVQGGEFQVNTYTTDKQNYPEVSVAPSGGFVVVWRSDSSLGTDTDGSVEGQRYASDGAPLGSQFQVNTYTTGYQGYASVTSDATGNFVVVWESRRDAGESNIQGQRFAESGSALGTEFQVSTSGTTEGAPAVASESNGDFVAVWLGGIRSGVAGPQTNVLSQRFTVPEPSVGLAGGAGILALALLARHRRRP